jgi:hypothetical protein
MQIQKKGRRRQQVARLQTLAYSNSLAGVHDQLQIVAAEERTSCLSPEKAVAGGQCGVIMCVSRNIETSEGLADRQAAGRLSVHNAQ